VLRIGMSIRSQGRLFRRVLTVSSAFLVALLVPALAFAFHTDGRETRNGALVACPDCHVTWTGGSDAGGSPATPGSGPHGFYRTDTGKCRMCHTVHKAPADSIMLLPAATIQDTCFTCHDNTGATGVYSAIEARVGPSAVVASHSIDATTHVPGGSEDLSTNLSCQSCHAVHRATTVAAFRTDRELTVGDSGGYKLSNALLRDDVGGKARGTYGFYGADWCAGCHDQRHSESSVVINHPVETSDTPDFFNYGRVAAVTAADETSTEILEDILGAGTGLGHTNFGYVMPWPRTTGTGGQDPHKPICQQCHEDARDVGVPGAAVGMVPSADGSTDATNPVFYSFPHQSTNPRLVIETYDDLCLNCHPPGSLP
jgi:predicted CXXCH cytochrome family protein